MEIGAQVDGMEVDSSPQYIGVRSGCGLSAVVLLTTVAATATIGHMPQ
jgi:hypothetical protein